MEATTPTPEAVVIPTPIKAIGIISEITGITKTPNSITTSMAFPSIRIAILIMSLGSDGASDGSNDGASDVANDGASDGANDGAGNGAGDVASNGVNDGADIKFAAGRKEGAGDPVGSDD